MSASGVIPPPEDRIPGLPFTIGSVVDVNGQRLNVGVVDDLVVIGPFHTILTIRLNRKQREEFSRLYFEAERQAEAVMPP